MKKILLTILKLSITILLFYFILHDKDLGDIYHRITNANPIYLILGVVTYFLIMVAFAIRWQLINRLFNIFRPNYHLFKHHLIGWFFSNLLPSSIGGDIWRIKYLTDFTENKAIAFVIPVIERISGMISVLFLGLFSFTYFSTVLEINVIYLAILFLSIIIVLFLMFNEKVYLFVLEFLKKHQTKKFVNKVISLIETVSVIQKHKKTFIYSTIMSLVSQILYALSSIFIAYSLNIALELWQFILIIPIIYFISIIPLTINGYGLKENAFVKLFILFGLAEATEALPLTILLTFVQIFVGLAGGLLFLFDKKEGKTIHEV